MVMLLLGVKDNLDAITCEIAAFNCVFKEAAVLAMITSLVPPAFAMSLKLLIPEVFPVVETPDTLAAKVIVSEVSTVVSLVGFIVTDPEVAPATIVDVVEEIS